MGPSIDCKTLGQGTAAPEKTTICDLTNLDLNPLFPCTVQLTAVIYIVVYTSGLYKDLNKGRK